MRSILLAPLLCSLLFSIAEAESPVYFADTKLKEAVEAELWISDPTPTDMLGLTAVHGEEHGIEDLKGLEYALNLQTLIATYGTIHDLSPLSGLANLQTLILSNNTIRDISSLSSLSSLQYLDIHDNAISDVSSLSGLTTLEVVIVRSNAVSDISTLSSLTNLRELILFDNSIRDLSALTGLMSLERVDVRNNPLEKEACANHIPQIIANNPGMDLAYNPCIQHRVVLSSTVGGTIVEPGEGEYIFDNGVSILLKALADPGFVFTGFSGTYASHENPSLLTVEQSHQIQANFARVGDTLYVDEDASGDPGPHNAGISDPRENGTPEQPFDLIQEAIEVAAMGATIFVHAGTYRETVDLLGKSIKVTGFDPEDPNRAAWPVIDGGGNSPVVNFTHGEDANCLLTGFVITGGTGRSVGAIRCTGASPTISNCLIVGNRGTDWNGAAILCTNSNAAFINCTIADNRAGRFSAGLSLVNSDVTVVNSILWGNWPEEIITDGNDLPSIGYSVVMGGWSGMGTRQADPLFAGPGRWVDRNNPGVTVTADDPSATWAMGDYHVQSQAGRWDPKTATWQQDRVTSPCIDAGDPSTPVGHEPSPNGGIINMGAYGGTAEASKSPLNTPYP